MFMKGLDKSTVKKIHKQILKGDGHGCILQQHASNDCGCWETTKRNGQGCSSQCQTEERARQTTVVNAQGVSCAHTDGHTCPGVTEVYLHDVLSHGTDRWDFSRNRKYMDYELDSKDVCKGVLCSSYREELKYCHFAG